MADEQRLEALELELVMSASQAAPEMVGAEGMSEKAVSQNGSAEEVPKSEASNTTTGQLGISYRRLIIIMTGLCLTIFLTALDQVCLYQGAK